MGGENGTKEGERKPNVGEGDVGNCSGGVAENGDDAVPNTPKFDVPAENTPLELLVLRDRRTN